MNWLLVAIIVSATAIGDLLQSKEMKLVGEVRDFRPGGIGRLLNTLMRRRYLLLAICFMAVSFFAFMTLVARADLSFAVPATAASYVVETLLAKLILKENIAGKRMAGACLVAGGVALLAV